MQTMSSLSLARQKQAVGHGVWAWYAKPQAARIMGIGRRAALWFQNFGCPALWWWNNSIGRSTKLWHSLSVTLISDIQQIKFVSYMYCWTPTVCDLFILFCCTLWILISHLFYYWFYWFMLDYCDIRRISSRYCQLRGISLFHPEQYSTLLLKHSSYLNGYSIN